MPDPMSRAASVNGTEAARLELLIDSSSHYERVKRIDRSTLKWAIPSLVLFIAAAAVAAISSTASVVLVVLGLIGILILRVVRSLRIQQVDDEVD